MSERNSKEEAVRYWWDKAFESLNAARRELAADAFGFAINRAYYALFYAVSALLIEESRRFKKHSGVRAAFNREIIKTGRLGRKHGDLYNQLFRDRQEGDYVEFAEFDAEYVREKIEACEAFLADIRSLIKSL
ncbi:MAG: HEPN domain-containing protein [Candidatus Latescibacteria bacterium]|nr:HEPN domain-containing protein [Candidatus Latescibacterota bacterium]